MFSDKIKSLPDLLAEYPNESSCIKFLEDEWPQNVISPFDPSSKVWKCKGGKYMCAKTGKYFNVKTGSIFESTKIPFAKMVHT